MQKAANFLLMPAPHFQRDIESGSRFNEGDCSAVRSSAKVKRSRRHPVTEAVYQQLIEAVSQRIIKCYFASVLTIASASAEGRGNPTHPNGQVYDDGLCTNIRILYFVII